MILDRTLPAVWQLRGADVPALAPIVSRGQVVVVDDVEYLCSAIVRELCHSRASYAPQTFTQMDDARGFLLGQITLLADKYDPTKGTAIHDPFTKGFRAWLYVELKRDLIDECRSRFGRQGQKHDLIDMRPYERDEEAAYAAQLDEADPNEDGVHSFADRLVAAIEGVAKDDPDDWLDGRGWFEHRRYRAAARKVEAVGLGAPAPAEGRDRSPVPGEELAA